MKHFFKILERLLRVINKIKMPWTKRILNYTEIREAMDKAERIDVLLVRAGGEASNILFKLLPGKNKFTHSAMCIGDNKITDATAIGVDDRDILAVLNGHLKVAILRPKLTEEEKEKVWQKYLEISELDKTDNIEYNYNLVGLKIREDGAPDATTCSQYMKVLLNSGRANFIKLRKVLGFETVTPDDLYDFDKFDLIYESDINRGQNNG